MRLRVKVIEGDDTATVLVPFGTFVAFKAEHGFYVNDCIPDPKEGAAGRPFEEWEPWVAWHAMKVRGGETRPFAQWCDEIDWVVLEPAPDEPDPSGGEANQTPPSSPDSSSAPTAGPTSSTSTTSSSSPSGSSSEQESAPVGSAA